MCFLLVGGAIVLVEGSLLQIHCQWQPQVEVIYRNGHVSDFVVAEDLLQRLMDRAKEITVICDALKIQVQDASIYGVCICIGLWSMLFYKTPMDS